MMSGTVQRAAETAVKRYEALLRVSRTLISIRSSEQLFKLLARELRSVVNFDFLRVGIYDENAPEPLLTLYGEPGVPLQVPSLPKEETTVWWVYQHQRPLIIPSLDEENRFPAVMATLRNRGVRSVCVLPLTTVHRRLGGLAVGSTEADAYSSEEVSFLSLVANQVALAVDNALNFGASQHANEALRASEQSLRLIVDNIPGLVGTRAATGEPEFVNRQMLEFFGQSLEQLPDWTSLIHPDDRERVVNLWRRSVETGQPYDVEHRARRADGVFRWLHSRAQPLRDAEGRIIRWCIMLTDVDDRKRAEEALRASELNFRVIIDSIPGLVHTLTGAGELEFVNQQNLAYFGKTLEELRSWASSDVFHPDDLARAIEAWKHTQETGQPDEIECRLRRADGVYRWFQLRCLPLRDSEDCIIRWMSLHTDIDDRKRAEEALRESEQSLRLIVDTIPGLVCTMNAAGEVERLNRQVLEYFGKTTEELKNWATSDAVHPDDLPRVIAAFTHSVETGNPYDIEHRCRRADGVYRWFQVRALPVRDTEGRVVSWYILLTDIDDRKRAEEALRASELNLGLVVGSIPGLVNTMTAEGKNEFVNQQVLDYFGKSQEELDSWATGDLVHPNDLPRMIAAFTTSIETEQPYDTEHRLRRADGVYRWFQVRALPLRDMEGRVARWYVLSTDIDERKQAEDRLQLLLDVTNQVVSNLQLRDLLRAVSGNIRRVMQCDCASLALPNAEKKELELNVLDFPEGRGFFHEEGVYSIEGSPYGIAFRTMKPLSLESPFTAWLDNPVVQSRIHEGFKSLCFIPLIRRNRAVGTLNLGRLRGDAFTEEDLYFLVQVASQIAIGVENALEYEQITEAKKRLADQTLYLENEIRVEHGFEEIIGNSPKLKAVLDTVRTVAPAASTVLIQGETGTGKELIARAIHNLSPRKGYAFVKVNCAAIPSGLLESDLFGHEKGSFTGAIAQKIGRFELADKGTLFLDEVGDIPLELQPKLLRVLQEQEFERLGSTRTQRVDVRVLAATHANLTQMVAEKKFRGDLYYRLNVFPVTFPPLRDRREDIPLLVRYFSNKYALRMGKHIENIPKEAMDALSHYAWPGNIRELQNLMERAVLLSTGPSLRVPLAEILADSGLNAAGGGNALEQAEREQIVRALRESNWVVGGAHGAAARLGLRRTSLAYKMQKLGISRPPQ
jgi:formate hydrogenlyase transcriptional activator